MSHSALSPGKVLTGGFIAPFRLGLRFWLQAAVPLALTLLLLLALPFAASKDWVPVSGGIACLLVLLPMSRVMVLFQRAVLGVRDEPADKRWWGAAETRYAVALTLLLLVAFVAVYALQHVLLPILASSLLFIVSTEAWVVLPGLAAGVAGVVLCVWLLTPLSLCLPAIAARRSPDPRHAWASSSGQRWRLAAIATAVPLVSCLIPDHLFEALPAWLGWPGLALTSVYLMLAWGAGLTLAYHELADPQLTVRPPALQGFAAHAAVTWAIPAGLACVVLGLGSLWAFGVMPGQYDIGHEVPEHISNPWLIRQEDSVYTIDKARVRMGYQLTWKVADERIYQRAFNSEPQAVSWRLQDQVSARIRHNVSRVDSGSLQPGQDVSQTLLPLVPLNEGLAPLGVVVIEARVERMVGEAP